MGVTQENLVHAPAVATPRGSVAQELLSFLFVGGAAALCFVGASSVLIELRTGIADWLVSAFCYAVMIVPVYLVHRRLSFRTSTPHGVALPRYVVVQVAGLVLATLFSFVCYAVFGLPAVPASLLVIGVTSGVNFLVLRLWAFAAPA
jgi:putative flippase GtrA